MFHDARDALAGALRQRAEGIAVEIDDAGRKLEAIAEFAQDVRAVEGYELLRGRIQRLASGVWGRG